MRVKGITYTSVIIAASLVLIIASILIVFTYSYIVSQPYTPQPQFPVEATASLNTSCLYGTATIYGVNVPVLTGLSSAELMLTAKSHVDYPVQVYGLVVPPELRSIYFKAELQPKQYFSGNYTVKWLSISMNEVSAYPGDVYNITSSGLTLVSNNRIYIFKGEPWNIPVIPSTYYCPFGSMIFRPRITGDKVSALITSPGCAPAYYGDLASYPTGKTPLFVVYDFKPIKYYYDNDITYYTQYGDNALAYHGNGGVKTWGLYTSATERDISNVTGKAGIAVITPTEATLVDIYGNNETVPTTVIGNYIAFGIARVARSPIPPIKIYLYDDHGDLIKYYIIRYSYGRYEIYSANGTLVSVRPLVESNGYNAYDLLREYGVTYIRNKEPGHAWTVSLRLKEEEGTKIVYYTVKLPYVGSAIDDSIILWDPNQDGFPEEVFRVTTYNMTTGRIAVIHSYGPYQTHKIYLGDQLGFVKDWHIREITSGSDYEWGELHLTLTPVYIGSIEPNYMAIAYNDSVLVTFGSHGYVDKSFKYFTVISDWIGPAIAIYRINTTSNTVTEILKKQVASGMYMYTGTLKYIGKYYGAIVRGHLMVLDPFRYSNTIVCYVEGTTVKCATIDKRGWYGYGYRISDDGKTVVIGAKLPGYPTIVYRFTCSDPLNETQYLSKACWKKYVIRRPSFESSSCVFGRRVETAGNGTYVIITGPGCNNIYVYKYSPVLDKYELLTYYNIKAGSNEEVYGRTGCCGRAISITNKEDIGYIIVATGRLTSPDGYGNVYVLKFTGASLVPIFHARVRGLFGYNPYYGWYKYTTLRALVVGAANYDAGVLYDTQGNTGYILVGLGRGKAGIVSPDAKWAVIKGAVFKLVDYDMPRYLRINWTGAILESEIFSAAFLGKNITIRNLFPGDIVYITSREKTVEITAKSDTVSIDVTKDFTVKDIVETIESGGFKVYVKLSLPHILSLIPNRAYLKIITQRSRQLVPVQISVILNCTMPLTFVNDTGQLTVERIGGEIWNVTAVNPAYGVPVPAGAYYRVSVLIDTDKPGAVQIVTDSGTTTISYHDNGIYLPGNTTIYTQFLKIEAVGGTVYVITPIKIITYSNAEEIEVSGQGITAYLSYTK